MYCYRITALRIKHGFHFLDMNKMSVILIIFRYLYAINKQTIIAITNIFKIFSVASFG